MVEITMPRKKLRGVNLTSTLPLHHSWSLEVHQKVALNNVERKFPFWIVLPKLNGFLNIFESTPNISLNRLTFSFI